MTHDEKTRLIAEFDGWEFVNDAPEEYPNGYWLNKDETNTNILQLEDMNYDLSYDWLMPVWHKFRDLRFRGNIVSVFAHSSQKDKIIEELTNGNEETLFAALAEAIEWFNTTKKQ